jgi:hypothetical protein
MDHWAADIETILEAIRQNCVTMSKEHRKRYFYLQGLLRYFKVPIIIISAINSVVSVGLQPYALQSEISVICCVLSLTVGILGSLELYLGISGGMIAELDASKSFYLLGTEIFKTLSLAADRRNVSGVKYLDDKYEEYKSLIETSNLISQKISDQLSPLPKYNLESLSNSTSSTNLDKV